MSRRGAAQAGLVDQMVSSIGNFSALAFVAAQTPSADFGLFALVMVTYQLLLSVSQAAGLDVMLFEYPRIQDGVPRHEKGALELAGIVGLLGGLASLILVTATGKLSVGLVCCIVLAPLLTLQDAVRHVFLASGASVKALYNDAVWTISLISTFVVVTASIGVDLTSALVVWGGTGSAAGLFGLWQMRDVLRHGSFTGYRAIARPHVRNLISEFVATNASGLATSYGLTFIFGLSATAGVRAASTVFSPLNVLAAACRLILVPWASRSVGAGADPRRISLRISVGFGIVSTLVAIAVLMLPSGVGRLFFGASWAKALTVLAPIAAARAASGFGVGYLVGLRAIRNTNQGARARWITSAAEIGLTFGFAAHGLRSAMWGAALAALFASLIFGATLVRATKVRSTEGQIS